MLKEARNSTMSVGEQLKRAAARRKADERAERAGERRRNFTDKDKSLVAAIINGVGNRRKPDLYRKFMSVLLSMANQRTVKFLLANIPNLNGTNTVLRTVQRWRAAYRFNMKPWMCRSNLSACADIYEKCVEDTGLTDVEESKSGATA